MDLRLCPEPREFRRKFRLWRQKHLPPRRRKRAAPILQRAHIIAGLRFASACSSAGEKRLKVSREYASGRKQSSKRFGFFQVTKHGCRKMNADFPFLRSLSWFARCTLPERLRQGAYAAFLAPRHRTGIDSYSEEARPARIRDGLDTLYRNFICISDSEKPSGTVTCSGARSNTASTWATCPAGHALHDSGLHGDSYRSREIRTDRGRTLLH